MNYIKEFVTGKQHSLIVCKSMGAVLRMFNSLGFNWISSDEYNIKEHLRKSGDCSFSFNDGVCDGFANLNWFRERQSRYCEHKLILGGLPSIIEVDDEF